VFAAVADRQPTDVWVLEGHRDCPPELLRALGERLALVDEQHFIHADVWRYRVRGP
jgi:hypothetical protein